MSFPTFPRLGRLFAVVALLIASAFPVSLAGQDEPGREVGAITAPPPPSDRSVHPVTVSSGETASFRAPDWPAAWAIWEYSPDDGATWVRIENGYFFENAHGMSLVVRNTSRAMDGYLFRVWLDGNAGTFLSDPGRLTVALPPGETRLINLSARAWVGPGANALIVGYVMRGSGVKGLLLRGIGPTLTNLGVTGALSTPRLTLFNSAGSVLDTNAGWGSVPVVESVARRVGAFALPNNSADTALIWSLNAGAYTTQVTTGNGATGVALAEIYDVESSADMKLVNLAARAYVGTGGDILIAGLVIGGSGRKTVLLRGIGPGLARLGVPGPLSRTSISVFDNTGAILATNAGWGTSGAGASPILAAAFNRVGAFSLESNSADSAMILTLPAGAYTVQLSGESGATGVGLIEVYELE